MRKIPVLLMLAAAAFAQKKPVTLESLYSGGGRGGRGGSPMAGMAGAPTWAPDGKSFVFRQGRELRLYDPAAKTSRVLVSTEAIDAAAVPAPREDGPVDWTNRRVRSAAMQWSADGARLLYAATGDLFLVDAATGQWQQVTKTAAEEVDPKLSPDGKTVAFRRGWDLYSIDIASKKETRLTTGGTETLRNGALDWVYPEELELGTAFWWSPDSRSIVYLQFDLSREPVIPHADLLRERALPEPQRYPQAGENNADVHVGVVAAAGGTTRWLDIGDTRHTHLVARAGWMPDSKHVFVLRGNRVQNRFELLSFDAATGDVSTILREQDPHWVNVTGEPVFLRDGRFLWISERDGFRHIYLYTDGGRDPRQLTRGTWEAGAIAAVDEAGGRVFYTSSEASPLERHLYSIGLDGGGKRRITTEPGTHSVSMAPGGAFFLDTWSNLQAPSRSVLRSGDGAEVAVWREADRSALDEYEILPTEIVTFKAADGVTTLHGRIIKPAGFQAGRKYPVIVTVYGGPGVPGPIRNAWPGLNADQVYAHRGFIVWESENRGILGHGHAFETPIYHKMGVTELADQVAGVKYLISLGYADAARVGIHGWSYGGFMTLNAMLNAPEVFRAGAAGAAVTSWLNYDTIYTERYMGLPAENRDGYRETALPARAANLKGRLMMMHNIDDDNVLFQNALQMTNALQLAQKQFEFMLYPQKSHGVGGAAARQMAQAMLDFFESTLK
jgi:dipeptidyl-peptidase-4